MKKVLVTPGSAVYQSNLYISLLSPQPLVFSSEKQLPVLQAHSEES